MTVLRHLLRATATLIMSVAVLAVVALGVSRHLGYVTEPVLSGSMVPTMPLGSVVVVKRTPADAIRVGDVITFQSPLQRDRRITHRVRRISHSGGQLIFATMGDANPTRDPWKLTVPGEVGRRVATVPYIGYALVYAGRGDVRRVLIVLVTLTMMLAAVRLIWRDNPRPATKQAT